LGIDLGTTITVCFAWIDGEAVPIHIDGEVKLPSVVNLKNPRLPVVGERAKNEQGIYPASTIVQAKRLIGQKYNPSSLPRIPFLSLLTRLFPLFFFYPLCIAMTTLSFKKTSNDGHSRLLLMRLRVTLASKWARFSMHPKKSAASF